MTNINFSHEQYLPIAELGRGGMGIVYKCRDQKLNKEVAVKVLAWNLSGSDVIRFHKEAKALAKMQHPNILSILECGHSDNDSLFIVMELLTGQSLSELMESDKSPPFDEALSIFIQMCDGLAHAHRKDILHRDIKPSNVFVERTARGEIKTTITDFGLAKLLTEDQRLTKTGIGLGSPPYMSPEQADGQPVDERSDIYSLGCLMFEVLVGELPFMAITVPQMLIMHIKEPVPTLSQRAADRNYPDEIDRIISRCLAKNPSSRYRQISDLRKELQQLRDSLAPTFAQHSDASGSYKPSAVILKSGAYLRTGLQNLYRPSRTLKIVVAIMAGIAVIWAWFAYKGYQQSEADSIATSESDRKKALAELSTVDKEKTAQDNKAMERKLTIHEVKGKWKNFIGDHGREKLFAMVKAADKTIDKGEPRDYIDLTRSGITDEDLKDLESIPLLGINLNFTSIGDNGLKSLSKITSLKEICLHSTNVTDDGVAFLKDNTSLKTLTVEETAVTDKTVTTVASFKNLDWLSLSKCKKVSGSTLEALVGSKVTSLGLGHTGVYPQNLAKLSKARLVLLNVAGLNLTDRDLNPIAQIEGLQILMLNNNPEITGEGLCKLANLKSLRMLHVKGCKNLGQAEFNQFRKIKKGVRPEFLNADL